MHRNTSTGLKNPRGPFAGAPGHLCRVAKAARPRHLVVQASRCRGERKKVARTRPRRRGARGERFAGAAGTLGGAPRGTQHIYTLGRRPGGCRAGRLRSRQSTRGEAAQQQRLCVLAGKRAGRRREAAARTCCLSHAKHKSCDEEVQSRGCTAAKTWRVGWQACMEAEHKRQGNTLAEQWIPRRRIGKGTG